MKREIPDAEQLAAADSQPPPLRCPICRPGQTLRVKKCPTCGRPIVAEGLRFSLATLLGLPLAVGVWLTVTIWSPGLGMTLLLFLIPAAIRTWQVAAFRRRIARTLPREDVFRVFFSSTGIVFLAIYAGMLGSAAMGFLFHFAPLRDALWNSVFWTVVALFWWSDSKRDIAADLASASIYVAYAIGALIAAGLVVRALWSPRRYDYTALELLRRREKLRESPSEFLSTRSPETLADLTEARQDRQR